MDTQIWAELKLSEEASDIHVKLMKVAHQTKNNTSSNKYADLLSPYRPVSSFNFKRDLDKMDSTHFHALST